MKHIYKYVMPFTQHPYADMAPGSIIHADISLEWITVWIEAQSGHPLRLRTFEIAGTGDEVPDGLHIVSAFLPPFVWHLYETTEVPF